MACRGLPLVILFVALLPCLYVNFEVDAQSKESINNQHNAASPLEPNRQKRTASEASAVPDPNKYFEVDSSLYKRSSADQSASVADASNTDFEDETYLQKREAGVDKPNAIGDSDDQVPSSKFPPWWPPPFVRPTTYGLDLDNLPPWVTVPSGYKPGSGYRRWKYSPGEPSRPGPYLPPYWPESRPNLPTWRRQPPVRSTLYGLDLDNLPPWVTVPSGFQRGSGYRQWRYSPGEPSRPGPYLPPYWPESRPVWPRPIPYRGNGRPRPLPWRY